MGFNACDVVYDTSEEASTWRQAKAAERNTRARARRGAGDQSRRRATDERPQPTDRQAFRDGCRACRSPPPSLSSLKAASGTLLSQLSPHFRPAAIIESLDRGEMGNGTGCALLDPRLLGSSTARAALFSAAACGLQWRARTVPEGLGHRDHPVSGLQLSKRSWGSARSYPGLLTDTA